VSLFILVLALARPRPRLGTDGASAKYAGNKVGYRQMSSEWFSLLPAKPAMLTVLSSELGMEWAGSLPTELAKVFLLKCEVALCCLFCSALFEVRVSLFCWILVFKSTS
jgi:hypothetical protein